MTVHAMIDIETLGLSNNSVIMQIGAVRSDRPNKFFVDIDIATQPERVIEASTLKWWKGQRNFHLTGLASLSYALENLHIYLQGVEYFWCKGIDFDFKILEHAYKSFSMLPPWKYNQCYDYRTLLKVAGPIDLPKNDDLHNALSDAEHQMAGLQLLLQKIKTGE